MEAARKAGDIIASYFEMTGLPREVKDDKSFVTKADKEAEEIIVRTIKASFPDHSILAEEGGEEKTASPYRWIIDPLDGTANFLNGIPVFGVSIGVFKNGEPCAAAVYHPLTKGMYSAARGLGVFWNGKKVKVSNQEAAQGVVTFGLGRKPIEREQFNKLFFNLEKVFKSRRHLGSAALEMAYIAAGGVEASVSLGTKPWDHAAGAVLILEAGGKITDFSGQPWKLGEQNFVASNGVAHEALLHAVKSIL